MFRWCYGFSSALFFQIKKSNEKMSILLINETVDLIKFAHFIIVEHIC